MEYEKFDIITDIKDLIKVYDILDVKHFDIISMRNGFSGCYYTLEEIGNKYNVGRERIRQLDKEANNSIKFHLRQHISKERLKNFFLFITKDIKLPYITIDFLIDFFNDEVFSFKVLYLYKFTKDICYSSEYKIIYDNSLITIEDIKNKIYDALKYSYSIEEYNDLPLTAKAIVKRNYSFINGIYRKKHFNKNDAISQIIVQLFSDGFKPGDENQLIILNENLKKQLGVAVSEYNKRNIIEFLRRNSFYLVDKGTYIYKESNANPRIDLKHSKIKKLKEDNDEIINNDFSISKKEENYDTGKEGKLKSFNDIKKFFRGKFSISDIKSDLNFEEDSIKQYLNFQFVYGLIYLGNNEYVYIENTGIDKVTINALDKFLQYAFKKEKTSILNQDVIFMLLVKDYYALYEELKYIDNPIALASLIDIKLYIKYKVEKQCIKKIF